MKTLKKFILLLLLTGLFTSGSCSDDEEFRPTLPPITQMGANTFGCYIDGKLLTPRDGTGSTLGPDPGMIFWGSPPGISYNQIQVKDYVTGTGGRIDIYIYELSKIGSGQFSVNQSNCLDGIDANMNINIRCRWWDENLQSYKWYCSIQNGGALNILRYDFENRIVSGTFECTVQNKEDPTDIIEITQGRFDIKWDTLLDTEFP
ncbi:hypothetical protein [Gelatiniphilus marinus]|uniref:Ig-like domain-containing protein n=1 Tax=Gelatiniphilus marinus TaxID=1759464 RepID=A0ABW5JTS8_9FLAO